MVKRGKIKLALIATLVLLLIISFVYGLKLPGFSSKNASTLNQENGIGNSISLVGFNNEVKIVERTATTDIYEISPGFFSILSYSKPVNIMNNEGIYRPYEEITQLNTRDNKLILEWNNKVVELDFYIKDKEEIKNSLSSLGAKDIANLNLQTNIEKRRGFYYFTHTLNKKYQPVKFGYDIKTQNVKCEAKEYSLICDEQIIDFSDAVHKQNLNVDIKINSIEISGEDLSYIDPTVSLYANDTGKIGYVKFDSPSDYTISEYSDVIIGCFQNCSDWVSRGLAFFAVNATDDNITIDSASLILNIEFENITTDTQSIYDVDEVGWVNASNSSKFSDLGSGNSYASNNTWGQTNGWKTISLNSQATNDIWDSIRENGYFGVGFKNSNESNNYAYIKINISSKDYMVLNVTYHNATAPITTASGNYSNNGEEYFIGSIGNRSVNITLRCNSCENTTYCTDTANSCNPSTLYFSPVTISTDGISYIRFKSTDFWGNQEEIKSEVINLELNQPIPSPIVWPQCNPAEPCCDINGFLRSSGYVCRSAHDVSCGNPTSCSGSAVEDRCDGVNPACPDSNNPITYNESCDDFVCSSQSCSGSTFQPERTCSVGICQLNNAYECPNNLNCLNSTQCKSDPSSGSDCKDGYSYDSSLDVCWLNDSSNEYDLRYDKNGNLIEILNVKRGLGLGYVYNTFNELEKVKDEGPTTLVEYTYDHLGNKIKSVRYIGKGNITTYYLDNFISVEDSTGGSLLKHNETYYYFYDTLVGERVNTGNAEIRHTNHLGSTSLRTNSSGDVTLDLQYEPYGWLVNDSDERYTYTGYEQEIESNLLYAQSRYYNPELGQFIQPDNIVGNLYDPQDLNKYAYVRNNPYKYTDPEGEYIETVADIGFIIWDIYDIIKYPSSKTAWASLGLDVVGAATPFATGLGAIYKAGAKGAKTIGRISDATKIVKSVDKTSDIRKVGKTASNLGKTGGKIVDAGKGVKGVIEGATKIPNINSLRQSAVRKAWKQERALVMSGRPGTVEWTPTQIQELISTGKVKGIQGHHIRSVSKYPQYAGNPSNVQFVDMTKHLELHQGNWRNPAFGELIERGIP